jgi:hypothetical protein
MTSVTFRTRPLALAALLVCLGTGCGDGSGGSSGAAGKAEGEAAPTIAAKAAPHSGAHSHDGKGGHSHGEMDDHGHGPTTELGTQQAGAFTVKASRDGDVTPGGELPVDIWVTGGTAQVTSVRFWIGIESGKGSVKAKGALEADNWHNHAEVPSPMPEGSKLWISIESSDGTKALVSFDLKL